MHIIFSHVSVLVSAHSCSVFFCVDNELHLLLLCLDRVKSAKMGQIRLWHHISYLFFLQKITITDLALLLQHLLTCNNIYYCLSFLRRAGQSVT